MQFAKKNIYNKNCSFHIISTHSHACPDTLGLWGPLISDGKNHDFMNSIIKESICAAREAYKNRNKGKLFFGSSVKGIENLQHDSRLPYVYDKNLYQLRFKPYDDSSGIRIINYAAHAESLGSENSKISADFPYYLCREIKKKTSDECMFIPGAIGGLIATEHIKDKYGFKSFPEDNVIMTGKILADSALSINNEKELKPEFKIVSKDINIPIENNIFIGLNAFNIISKQIIRTGEGKYGYSVNTKVSLIKLGNLIAVCVPGEIFPELVYGDMTKDRPECCHSIKDIINDDFLIFGLCDDEIGYIVPYNDFYLDKNKPYIEKGIENNGKKHYEETNSVGPYTAEIILNTVKELFEYL